MFVRRSWKVAISLAVRTYVVLLKMTARPSIVIPCDGGMD